ncbi:MAG TPA: hypothetical protein VEY70_03280 [Metabacillus sp.]|nr:hypothetical protein [Metabacillus sp.]
MDIDLIWKSVVIVIGGTILLRIAGRKSISQMTLSPGCDYDWDRITTGATACR